MKKDKSKSCKREKKSFFFAFAITLSVIMLIYGFIKVDYTGRVMSRGDKRPPFELIEGDNGRTNLHIYTLGLQRELDVTQVKKGINFLFEFCCIPFQLLI